MRTTFAIMYKDKEFPIAHRWYNGEEAEFRWLNGLGELLPNKIKVAPTDNDHQGIKTIGEIKKKINE